MMAPNHDENSTCGLMAAINIVSPKNIRPSPTTAVANVPGLKTFTLLAFVGIAASFFHRPPNAQ